MSSKYLLYLYDIKQQSHGPHRSPEKPVQINENI